MYRIFKNDATSTLKYFQNPPDEDTFHQFVVQHITSRSIRNYFDFLALIVADNRTNSLASRAHRKQWNNTLIIILTSDQNVSFVDGLRNRKQKHVIFVLRNKENRLHVCYATSHKYQHNPSHICLILFAHNNPKLFSVFSYFVG